MRSRSLALSLVMAAALAGCARGPEPRPAAPGSPPRLDQPHLVQPGSPEFGAALPDTRPEAPYTFGDVVLCLDRPGSATVEGVSLVGASGGLRLDSFATRPGAAGRDQVGGATRPLVKLGFAPGRATVVHGTCHELGLQFSKATDATEKTQAMDVHYRTANWMRTSLRIPFTLILCKGRDPAVQQCR